MRLALRELRRQPGRFAVAAVILTLLAVLLMFLGGLLDGLLASSTGAYRIQRADLIVYSEASRESLVRSRIAPNTRATVEATPGVDTVGGLGSLQLGARPDDEPNSRDLLPTILFGYELAPAGLPERPPAPGTVIADSVLRADGVEEGDTLLLGPARSAVQVIGFVNDSRYSGQASLWGSLETWRTITADNRPAQVPGETVQALVVRTTDADPGQVADAIDEATAATAATTSTLTLGAAIEALPGVSQQRSTFNQIIGVTVAIALVVVALFFALLTVERTALYGILKAIGGSNSGLFVGLVVQAVVVTLVASAIGITGALVLEALIPPGSLPFELSVSRLATSVFLLLLAAVAGCALSLRRVLRIDPAAAIGTAS